MQCCAGIWMPREAYLFSISTKADLAKTPQLAENAGVNDLLSGRRIKSRRFFGFIASIKECS
jgi:hypothetical protein